MFFAYLLILLTILENRRYEMKYICPEGMINCYNGICVPDKYRCDGYNDCFNFKDEEDCGDQPEITCHSEEFSCDNSTHCIPSRWRCDRYPNCLDETDEKNCSSYVTCGGFQCDNFETCIPKEWKCDYEEDCEDGSDEKNCASQLRKHCSITEDNSVCTKDEHLDCSQMHCEHKCMEIGNNLTCYCPPGFKLNTDKKSCVDINECEIEGYCSQICTNVKGGAHCSCQPGYTLSEDRTCRVPDDDLTTVIFSDWSDIKMYTLQTHEYEVLYRGDEANVISAVHYDFLYDELYWISRNKKYTKYTINFLPFNEIEATVLPINLVSPEDIAVDSLAGNIYIAESELKSIIVCQLNGKFCTLLARDEFPKAIVLDITSGFMYWCSSGSFAVINKQGMDGSKQNVFVHDHLSFPHSLAIDYAGKHLYWSDTVLNTLERIKLDGTGRMVIFRTSAFHPVSIDIFEDNIYWTDWIKYSIETSNKIIGKNYSVLVRDNHRSSYLTILQYVHFDLELLDNCKINHCDQLCLQKPSGFTCACTEGYWWSKGLQKCIPDRLTPRLFIIQRGQLYIYFPHGISQTIHRFTLPAKAINYLAYDWIRSVLYVSEVDVPQIAAISTTDFKRKNLVSSGIRAVSGLQHDLAGDNIYWTDSEKGTIEVITYTGVYRKTLVQNLVKPYNLALDQEKGYMCVAVMGYKSSIKVYELNGKFHNEVLNAEGATSFSLDPIDNKLYWLNPKDHRIMESTKYHDPLHDSTPLEHQPNASSIETFVVGEDYLFWFDLESTALHYKGQLIKEQEEGHIDVDEHINQITKNRKLIFFHLEHGFEGRHSCEQLNCSQLCLANWYDHECDCADKYELTTDKVTCIESSQHCKFSEILCNDGKCVVGVRCDGIFDCHDHSDEEHCDILPGCLSTEVQCENGECVKGKKCDGVDDCVDKSDELHCEAPSACHPYEYQCENGDCVTGEKCDGINDCIDGSDEFGCDDCSDDYCFNNGECVMVKMEKECQCSKGFEGERCEEEEAFKMSEEGTNSGLTIFLVLLVIVILPVLAIIISYKTSSKFRNRSREIFNTLTRGVFVKKEPLVNESNSIPL